MTRWPRVGSLVLVRWRDADGPTTRDGGDRDDCSDDCVVETVGWLWRRTRRYASVAAERMPPGYADRYRGTTRIPPGWVVEVVRIA